MFPPGPMCLQGSLFGAGTIEVDERVAIDRTTLDATSWVDFAPECVRGADELFDELRATVPWRQRVGIQMYDNVVDEPRLVHWVQLDQPTDDSDGASSVERCDALRDMRRLLDVRYGVRFDSVGFNLYRDGRDSVAWHGDRNRLTVTDPIVAIISVGAARPFRVRARGGGSSRTWHLGHGDLFVMGGACQHDWEHCVPKVRSAGPRISITFRHGCA